MAEPNTWAILSPSVPPLFSRNHFMPHSVKFSALLGETGTAMFGSITGSVVLNCATPVQLCGSALWIPDWLNVLISDAASVACGPESAERKSAISAAVVIGRGNEYWANSSLVLLSIASVISSKNCDG